MKPRDDYSHHLVLNDGETFVECLTRCFSKDELQEMHQELAPKLIRKCPILSTSKYMSQNLRQVRYLAQDNLPEIWHSDRYDRQLKNKWQYRIIDDKIVEAINMCS